MFTKYPTIYFFVHYPRVISNYFFYASLIFPLRDCA